MKVDVLNSKILASHKHFKICYFCLKAIIESLMMILVTIKEAIAIVMFNVEKIRIHFDFGMLEFKETINDSAVTVFFSLNVFFIIMVDYCQAQ